MTSPAVAATPFTPQRLDFFERQQLAEDLQEACLAALAVIGVVRPGHSGIHGHTVPVIAPCFRDDRLDRIEWLLLPQEDCPDEEELLGLFSRHNGHPSAHQRLETLAAFDRVQQAASAFLEPLLPAALALHLPGLEIRLDAEPFELHVRLNGAAPHSPMAESSAWIQGIEPILDAFERAAAAAAWLGPELFPPAARFDPCHYTQGELTHPGRQLIRTIRHEAGDADSPTRIRRIAAHEAVRTLVCDPGARTYPWLFEGFHHDIGPGADAALQAATAATLRRLIVFEEDGGDGRTRHGLAPDNRRRRRHLDAP